ncbi:MAG: non-canonical purine NTP pyrophosphatase [Candidatus Parcubacteria bacterium]|nr:MAG: non-canonical purine NTP pyrophosphatase [Candidatus Parcubacteria bacterium]
MKIKSILIGTKNKAKINEIRFGLRNLENLGLKIIDLESLKFEKDVEENGETFKENALIKAKFYYSHFNIPVISDDGGLLIPYLNNEPGVKSRRWLGYKASDEELIEAVLTRMKTAKGIERKAYLYTCMCFYDYKNEIVIFEEEKISGYIANKPSQNRINGYPYRSLFIVEKFNKYYDDLSEEEHNKLNHRLIALQRLANNLPRIYI